MEKVQREIFFSIIIPIYNMEKYLEKCINSIVCQKFDGYEIILVDDGSRDSSFQIAQKLSEQYRNIKCFKKKTYYFQIIYWKENYLQKKQRFYVKI